MRDKFTTLPETNERILATTISAGWAYDASSSQKLSEIDFCAVHEQVKDCVMKEFFGPPPQGEFSPGVQRTLYLSARYVLDSVSCISSVRLSLPNLHFLPCDLPVFQNNGLRFENDLYIPTDEPHGIITATVTRGSRMTQAKL